MELFADAQDPTRLEGRWETFKADKDDPERSLQACVRRITAKEDQAITRRAGIAAKSKVTYKREGAVVDNNREANIRQNVLRACAALVDTKNADVRVADAEGADWWAKALGMPPGGITVGELVRLDGRWTDTIKERVFTEQNSFRVWVVQQADRQELEADEDDAGKDATS